MKLTIDVLIYVFYTCTSSLWLKFNHEFSDSLIVNKTTVYILFAKKVKYTQYFSVFNSSAIYKNINSAAATNYKIGLLSKL